MPEDPEIDQMQQYTHISFFFIVRRGRLGDKKEAHTNTLIIKDKILRLNSVLIPKVKRQLKSKDIHLQGVI